MSRQHSSSFAPVVRLGHGEHDTEATGRFGGHERGKLVVFLAVAEGQRPAEMLAPSRRLVLLLRLRRVIALAF